MVPIVGGLSAAFIYTLSVLASARASRRIGAESTVGWAMTVGLVAVFPVAAVTTSPPTFDRATLIWFVLAGLGNVVGLLLNYAAYRIGSVAVVITIASSEGAIAAVLAVQFGEALAPETSLILAAIAIGVVITASASAAGAEGRRIDRAQSLRAVLLAIASAASFGVGLYSAGRLSTLLPIPWAIMAPRLFGFLIVALPLMLLRRNRLDWRAAPLVVIVGLSELVGAAFYNWGAREAIAITAVLSTLFAPLSSIAAVVLFRERLARRQVVGITLVAVGVASLGVLQR